MKFGTARILKSSRETSPASRRRSSAGGRVETAAPEERKSEHYIEWEVFWNDFKLASLDEKLEMARERIDNAPDFDEEWVFSLMIDGLLMPCNRENRGDDWLATLDYLREKRPEFVEPESGVLGAYAVSFSLAGERAHLDRALELLFSNPGDSVDHILATLEQLAYRGDTRALDILLARWSFFGRTRGVSKAALSEWVEWTARAQLAAWVEQEPQQPRTFQQLEDALGYMLTSLTSKDAARVAQCVAGFAGSGVDAFDATAFAKTEDPAEQAAVLGFAFARSFIA